MGSISLTENVRGLWGGLLTLGNAPCSFSGDVSEQQIEGIPASETNGLMGNNPADNSEQLDMFPIRHGGAEIGEGNNQWINISRCRNRNNYRSYRSCC